MEKIKNIFDPASKQDTDALYGTGSNEPSPHNLGKVSGEGSHFGTSDATGNTTASTIPQTTTTDDMHTTNPSHRPTGADRIEPTQASTRQTHQVESSNAPRTATTRDADILSTTSLKSGVPGNSHEAKREGILASSAAGHGGRQDLGSSERWDPEADTAATVRRAQTVAMASGRAGNGPQDELSSGVSHPAENPRKSNITPFVGESQRSTAGLPVAQQFTSGYSSQEQQQHHYGRDAALGAGAVGTGATAYEAKRHHDQNAPQHAQTTTTTTAPTMTTQTNIPATGAPTSHTTVTQPQAMQQDHHYGRDAVIGSGVAGAGGTAAYEAEKHHQQHQQPAQYQNTAQPIQHQAASQQHASREKDHHYGRDAAIGAGATGTAAYGIDKEEQARREKEFKEQQKHAEKEQAKAEKQHDKEVKKEQKEHEKEIKKEQKEHHKEVVAAEKEREKEEKEAEKEHKKAEKEHKKEVAAMEKEQKEREKEAEKEQKRRREEAAAAVAAAGGAGGAAIYEHDKHREDPTRGQTTQHQTAAQHQTATQHHTAAQPPVTQAHEQDRKHEDYDEHGEKKKGGILGGLLGRKKDQDEYDDRSTDDHKKEGALAATGAGAGGAGLYEYERHRNDPTRGQTTQQTTQTTQHTQHTQHPTVIGQTETRAWHEDEEDKDGKKGGILGGLLGRKGKDEHEDTTTTDHRREGAVAATGAGAGGAGLYEYEKRKEDPTRGQTTQHTQHTQHPAVIGQTETRAQHDDEEDKGGKKGGILGGLLGRKKDKDEHEDTTTTDHRREGAVAATGAGAGGAGLYEYEKHKQAPVQNQAVDDRTTSRPYDNAATREPAYATQQERYHEEHADDKDEKKKGGILGLLGRNKDKDETEGRTAEAENRGAVAPTAAETRRDQTTTHGAAHDNFNGHDHEGRNKLHKDPPPEIQQKQAEMAGNLATDPVTGLKQDISKADNPAVHGTDRLPMHGSAPQ